VELSPEAYQSILDQATAQAKSLVNFIAEMQAYRQGTDGQLAGHVTRLNGLQADAKALSDAVTAFRKDYESWKAQFIATDAAHDQKLNALQAKDGAHDATLAQLAGQTEALDALLKSVQQAVNALGPRMGAVETKNTTQDTALAAVKSDLLSSTKILRGTHCGDRESLSEPDAQTDHRGARAPMKLVGV